MIRSVLKFALARPMLSLGLVLGVASAIFGAGMRTGAHVEHLSEAGKRETIQEDLIQCQGETKGFREAEATALRQLRDAELRLANADEVRLEYAERRAAEIESALQRALNAIEPNANCVTSPAERERLRDILGPRPGGSDRDDSGSAEAGQ